MQSNHSLNFISLFETLDENYVQVVLLLYEFLDFYYHSSQFLSAPLEPLLQSGSPSPEHLEQQILQFADKLRVLFNQNCLNRRHVDLIHPNVEITLLKHSFEENQVFLKVLKRKLKSPELIDEKWVFQLLNITVLAPPVDRKKFLKLVLEPFDPFEGNVEIIL